MANLEGEKFLDKLYKELYMSELVQHTKDNKDSRLEAIKKYMDRLERIHNMADSDEKKEHIASLYYKKYVIKEENIPHNLDKMTIINDQKKKLRVWLDYLTDQRTSYPMWAKYWAFQGMLKMGTKDETKETYLKRDEKTTAPFVDCNSEIVTSCIDFIVKSVNGEELNDEEVNKLNKMDSFNKIYSYFEKKYKSNIIEKSDSTDGVWIKYNQGSKEEALKLNKSLANKNTGWCTAASEDMAIKQVCGPYNDAPNGGDFYVYYTKNKNGEYTIPRIAIRLKNHDQIGEIRGIEDCQNLEEVMIDILEQQLKSMKNISEEDVNKNLLIVSDLRKLTKINVKTSKNEVLSEDELIDLYTKKFGFGYQNDPRVLRIMKKRNVTEDFNNIKDFDVKKGIILSYMLPENSVNDKKLMMEAVKKEGIVLRYASAELRNDKELVHLALKKSGLNLKYASDELKNDESTVLLAVENYLNALYWASHALRNNKKFVIKALEKGANPNFISPKFLNDKNFILEILKKYHISSDILEHLPIELMEDRDIILEYAKHFNLTSKNAKHFENDEKIILTAVKYHPSSICCASSDLLEDEKFVLNAIKSNAFVISELPKKYSEDKKYVIEAIRNNALVYDYIDSNLKRDRDVLIEVFNSNVKNIISLIDYIPDDLWCDREFALKAVQYDSKFFNYVAKELMTDKDFVIDSINSSKKLKDKLKIGVTYNKITHNSQKKK